MNKIVKDHYPVARLPGDLREGLDPATAVRVSVEVMPGQDVDSKRERMRQILEGARRLDPIGDDPVERIRALRDEWDD